MQEVVKLGRLLACIIMMILTISGMYTTNDDRGPIRLENVIHGSYRIFGLHHLVLAWAPPSESGGY